MLSKRAEELFEINEERYVPPDTIRRYIYLRGDADSYARGHTYTPTLQKSSSHSERFFSRARPLLFTLFGSCPVAALEKEAELKLFLGEGIQPHSMAPLFRDKEAAFNAARHAYPDTALTIVGLQFRKHTPYSHVFITFEQIEDVTGYGQNAMFSQGRKVGLDFNIYAKNKPTLLQDIFICIFNDVDEITKEWQVQHKSMNRIRSLFDESGLLKLNKSQTCTDEQLALKAMQHQGPLRSKLTILKLSIPQHTYQSKQITVSYDSIKEAHGYDTSGRLEKTYSHSYLDGSFVPYSNLSITRKRD